MNAGTASLERSTTTLVRIFCYVILGGALVGLAAAHLPWIIGHPWSNCRVSGNQLGCSLLFHLYGVPLVVMNLVMVWYGLMRFSTRTLFQFGALVSFMVVANAAYLTLETFLLIDLLRRGAPNWESLTLVLVSIILIVGCAFGIYVVHRLITAAQGSSPTNTEA